jgi:hypothetical protein
LAVPKHSVDEALVRIAGATAIVNAANGLSVNDVTSTANLSYRSLTIHNGQRNCDSLDWDFKEISCGSVQFRCVDIATGSPRRLRFATVFDICSTETLAIKRGQGDKAEF